MRGESPTYVQVNSRGGGRRWAAPGIPRSALSGGVHVLIRKGIAVFDDFPGREGREREREFQVLILGQRETMGQNCRRVERFGKKKGKGEGEGKRRRKERR